MIQIENEMHGASSKLGPGVVVIIFTKKIIYELKKKTFYESQIEIQFNEQQQYSCPKNMAVHAYQPELLASKPQSVSIEGPSLQKSFPWEFDPLATTELRSLPEAML